MLYLGKDNLRHTSGLSFRPRLSISLITSNLKLRTSNFLLYRKENKKLSVLSVNLSELSGSILFTAKNAKKLQRAQ